MSGVGAERFWRVTAFAGQADPKLVPEKAPQTQAAAWRSKRFKRKPSPELLDTKLQELVDEADIASVASAPLKTPKLPEYMEDDASVFVAAQGMVADRISDYEEFPWSPGAPRLQLLQEADKRKAEHDARRSVRKEETGSV